GKVIANHISGPKGVFEFKLNYGNDYIIAFSKDGYVTKLINVLAKNVTQDMVSIGQKDQDWTVGLFKYMEGIDYSDLDHPVGKVYFEPSSKTFDWDAGYSLGILQKMQDLQ